MELRKKLCILHWMPVEFFPPAINMVRYFAGLDEWEVSLCTSRNHLGHPDFTHSKIDMTRGTYPTGQKGLRRLAAYASFHTKSFWHLFKHRPDVILYIEPHSALPVFLARKFNRHARLFIHYHEYHSPADFTKPGMRMAGWFHRIEKKRLYPVAKWVSQTNKNRLKLFLEDNPEVGPSTAKILPNYPPSSWWEGDNRAWMAKGSGNAPIRFVYVGALSRVDTFITQVVEWIQRLGPQVASLDIFSYNLHEETRAYLRSVSDGNIHFHEEGVAYDELPRRLRYFHVGLILYKGNSTNYVYNTSNKLFEYLACGLDVLYPRQMIGVKPYATQESRPRVIECDFEQMDGFTFQSQGRTGLPASDAVFNCEAELRKLEVAMSAALKEQD